MRYAHGYPGMNPSGFMMIPAILFTIILIIVLVYLVVRIIKQGHVHGHSFTKASLGVVDNTSKALEILNVRYANGEITDEEYVSKKEQLLKQVV